MNIRLVVGPDGYIYYDPSGKAAGESILIDIEQLKEVIESREIEAKLSAKLSDDFLETMHKQLINRFKTNLSLAKKAGVVVINATKVLEGLNKGSIQKVLIAENAGKDISKKLQVFKQQYTCLLHTNVYDEALNGSNIVLVGITKPTYAKPLFDTIKIITSMR